MARHYSSRKKCVSVREEQWSCRNTFASFTEINLVFKNTSANGWNYRPIANDERVLLVFHIRRDAATLVYVESCSSFVSWFRIILFHSSFVRWNKLWSWGDKWLSYFASNQKHSCNELTEMIQGPGPDCAVINWLIPASLSPRRRACDPSSLIFQFYLRATSIAWSHGFKS